MIQVIPVRTSRELRRFIDLPYRLYRGDANFVPPLRSQIKAILTGRDNLLFQYGPHELLLCLDGRRVVGRILVGIDEAYDRENGYRSAWFSLFEAETAAAVTPLLQAAETWSRSHGADFMRGPESPENGDSYKGILVMGFDGPPALMNSYNPDWYGRCLEEHGYGKRLDLYAYAWSADAFRAPGLSDTIAYAQKKFAYHVDCLDRAHLDRDLCDIHQILVETIPTFQDEHMAIPSLDDVRRMARSMLPVADTDLICIARTDMSQRPIGFVVALPEYNQVLRHLRDGRFLPFGLFKWLYYKSKITAVRVFMQFVVPDYQRKGVNHAIFYRMYQTATARGYVSGDGSTIGETNKPSRLSVEKLGGRHYRTYRLYKKQLNQADDPALPGRESSPC
jgi:GNAT superfamily N-acetyltransferase